MLVGGSGEIRTHGGFPHDGFQDRCIKPLCHASVLKRETIPIFCLFAK